MWRDRTNLYISYRQSYSHHPAKRPRYTDGSNSVFDDDRRGLLSSIDDDDAGDVVVELDVLPPRWADASDEVSELLAGIARKSARLERLHGKHVLPGFDDNRSEEEGEIERLTADITADFHACQERIAGVGRMLAGAPRAEERMGKNVQVALAARVQDASTLFRKKQSAYLKKLRGISDLNTPLEARTASPATESDPAADVSFSQSALQASAMLTSNDSAILQREREITDIARGIIELADIFKELQTMVIDQGTMLDRIDYNVEQLHVNVREAEKEMNVASGYQKKTTKRKIIFLLFLIILGLIIVLVIKPKQSATEAPAPVTVHPPPVSPTEPTPPTPPTPPGDVQAPGIGVTPPVRRRVRRRERRTVVLG